MRLEHGGAEHGPAREHGQDRNPGGHGPGLPPVIAMRRVERLGETRPAERPGPVDHPRPVGRRGRAHVVDQVEQLVAQPRRGQRDGQHAEQHGRVQLMPPAVTALLAVLGVPVDALAEQDVQLSVPAGQHGRQLGAGLLPGAGDQQRSERRLEPGPGPRHQGVRLAHAHAEDVGEVLPAQVMAQVELDDLPVAGAEPGEGRARRRAELRPLGVRGQVDRLVGQLVRRVGFGGQRARTQAVAAFVARHGIEPGPELAGIAQPVQFGVGDDERVQDRIVGVGRVAQQAAAVGMQSGSVPVIDGLGASST